MIDATGFPCPRCGEAIRADVARLAAGAPLFCGACGLRLEVDLAASGAGLKAAQEYQQAMATVKDQGTRKGGAS
jgi:transcription elongation factor Elf1